MSLHYHTQLYVTCETEQRAGARAYYEGLGAVYAPTGGGRTAPGRDRELRATLCPKESENLALVSLIWI